MATNLDLQEQEQLEEFKHLWAKYGTFILALVTVSLLAYAGWQGWRWYQNNQSIQAAMMFDEIEKAQTEKKPERIIQVSNDLKNNYPSTVWAEQAALIAAKTQLEEKKLDDAKASLQWVVDNAKQEEYQWLGKIRLAGVLMEEKKFEEALKSLQGSVPASFEALVADRRGDILQSLGKRDDAIQSYQEAMKKMDKTQDYYRLIDAKLQVLGVVTSIEPATAASAASGA